MARMMAFLIFFSSTAFGFQENDRIRRMVEKLADQRIEERESAMRELVAIGKTAIPELQKALRGKDPELRSRANQAILEIDRQSRIGEVFRETAPISIRMENAPLPRILRELSAKTGVKITAEERLGDLRASLDLSGGTLMQALDSLGRQTGKIQWYFGADGSVVISRGKFLDQPTFYSGGFRLAVRRIDVYRSTSFEEDENRLMWLGFGVKAEPGLKKALPKPIFLIKKISDDAGRDLKFDHQTAPNIFPARQMEDLDSFLFGFGGLSSDSRKLAIVQGEAVFYFPILSEEVILKDLDKDPRAMAGDITISSENNYTGAVQLTIYFTKRGPRPSRAFDYESVEVTDKDGKKHYPGPADVQEYSNASPEKVSFYIYFDRSGLLQADSVKLRVFTEFYEKRIPFEFKDVALPR